MKRFIISFLLILAAADCFPQKENNSIDSLMSSFYNNDQPGAAIAIVKNGEVVFKKGYGIADMDSKMPVTSSTNFNICSMTKQFTAYGILKLAGEKKLSLDDKIDKYFPDFNSKVAGVVTIRHLLTHSSGIVDHYGYVDKGLFKEFWDKDALNAIESVDSVYFKPGSGYQYSNTAFCLLSLIIGKVSGYSFPEFIQREIFKPLRMNNSGVIKPGFKISERALGYEFEKDSFKISDAGESLFFSTMGDGGIYTSINDYLKWIMAIQNGDVLNQDIIKKSQSAQFSIDSGRNLSYGYGWFVSGSGDNKTVYHTGSNGGFRTIIFMVPSKKYSVVIFSNRTGIDLEDLVHEINRIFKTDDASFIKLKSLIS
ncbi:MAG TPA: serine hydrolase domain-containing protein [Bacteroidales bacterium]|nr:serine hydrolase domain-containing protein [Bacteroidales bacterium]HPT21445.1 serine hydrolase domain-containing protein [Bacteroidales bacterium]